MLAFVVADPQAGHDPTVIGILMIVSIDILIVAPYHRSFALLRTLTVCCLRKREKKKEWEREREKRGERFRDACMLRWDMIESISLINDTLKIFVNGSLYEVLISHRVADSVVVRAFFFEIFRFVGGFNFRKLESI